MALDTIAVLKRAGWRRGAPRKGAKEGPLCLVEAIDVAMWRPTIDGQGAKDSRGRIYAERVRDAHRQVYDVLQGLFPGRWIRPQDGDARFLALVRFNDHPKTTFVAIQHLLKIARI